MAENNAWTKNIRSPRIPLIVIVSAAAAVDLAAFVLLAVAGAPSAKFALPLVSLAVGGAFILVTAVSNFRFRYANVYFALYAIVYLVLGGIAVALNTGEPRTMTNGAMIMWTAEHVAAVAAAIIAKTYASKRMFLRGVPGAIVAYTFAAIGVAVMAVYGAFLGVRGFFGQGGISVRPVEYSLAGDGKSYTAQSVMSGRGGTVVIPATFNGIPVTEISANVFTASGVSAVRVEADEFALTDLTGMAGASKFDGFDLQLKTSAIDGIKRDLYALGYNNPLLRPGASENLFALANAARPYDVPAGEHYVTFSYDRNTYERLNGEVFDTWHGKAGETINPADISTADYMDHCDEESDDDLDWAYKNLDGYIFRGLHAGETDLLTTAINADYDRIEVTFDKIYRFTVAEDNDTVYTIPEEERISTPGGNFKYTVARHADKNLARMTREGFDVEWTAGGRSFTSLESALKAATSTMPLTITPEWTMCAPTITAIKQGEAAVGDTVSTVYGNKVTLTGEATAAANEFKLSYSWHKGTENSEGEVSAATRSFEKILRSDAGRYFFVVECTSTGSSLSSKATRAVDISVDRRPVRVTWTDPSDKVYSAKEINLGCALNADDIVSGDSLTWKAVGTNAEFVSVTNNEKFVLKNAKSYTAQIELAGAAKDNYVIAPGQDSHTVTITPAPISVEWGGLSQTYDNKDYTPTVSVTPLSGDESKLSATCSDNGKETGSYAVRATLSGEAAGNYTLTNPSNTLTITAKEITLTWESKTFTYSGAAQYPTVTGASGYASGHSSLDVLDISYTGYENNINAKDGNTVTAVLGNTNYTISGDPTKTYTINPKGITLIWSEGPITYSGSAQHPTVTGANGLVQGENVNVLNVAYSGYANNINAGGDYTVTAEIKNNNNYTISDGSGTKTYSIEKKGITLTWENKTFTYSGSAQYPTVTSATGLVNTSDFNELVAYSEYESNINAGEHSVKAELRNNNYTISDGSGTKTYSIGKATLTITIKVTTTATEGEDRPDKESIEADYDVSGLVGGEQKENVIQSVKYKYVSDEPGNPGYYQVTADVADVTLKSSNYEVVEVIPGTMAVSPKGEVD